MKREHDIKSLIAGAALGAGLVYVLDGALGSRRRARMRDKANHLANEMRRAIGLASRDFVNKAQGLISELTPGFAEAPIDDVLTARVRSEMGRWISHPHAITVQAKQGTITLSGLIFNSEERNLIRKIKQVRGVKNVENKLKPHQQQENALGLQGRGMRIIRSEFWTPAPRMLAGTAGAIIAAYGITRRDLTGFGLMTTGAALLARAVMNMEIKSLIGASGQRSIDLQKTITVNAPPEHVFSFWADYKNMPKFMSHVKKVEDCDNGLSRWIVSGPAGTTVEFTARITDWIQDKLIAWQTEPDAKVQHAGVVRFNPSNGGTCVHVRLSYCPPAGVAGHALASIFGVDPKTQMDEGLLRMKTFIETWIPPRDAGERPELQM